MEDSSKHTQGMAEESQKSYFMSNTEFHFRNDQIIEYDTQVDIQKLPQQTKIYSSPTSDDEIKRHNLFKQKRFLEALEMYNTDIRNGTTSVRVYIHAADIFTNEKQFSQAISHYEKAIQLNPYYSSAHIGLGLVFFKIRRYEDAIVCFKKMDNLNITGKTIAFLKIGDTLTILKKDIEALDAYNKCLDFSYNETQLSITWHLADALQCSYRPANVQVKLYQYALVKDYSEVQANKVFAYIGEQYEKLFNTNIVKAEDIDKNIQTLYTLLNCVPEIDREQFLRLCIQNDSQRIIQILLVLAPIGLSGLTNLVLEVTEKWDYTIQQDETTNRFYQVLSIYQIPEEKIVMFFGTYLMEQRRFEEAEQLLAKFFGPQQENPDILWLLALILKSLRKSPPKEIELLERFVTHVSTDTHVATAYHRIGDIYGSLLHDGNKAITAYKEAERHGSIVPQLQEFRRGNWDAIPALRTHPDYAYPLVVAIDLENDYTPDAPAGSRVIEIAVVRAKGCTELDTYQAVVKRSWVANKVSQRQNEAKEPKQVVKELEIFFAETYGGTPILVGHNIQAFDVIHLRAMGFGIHDDQLVDTLVLARHLYPDSLHHNLGLLCNFHRVVFQGEAHTALPDARACLHLLHALGEELVGRGERLIGGFRAFTTPDSAFDRAILQPRGIVADPAYTWKLDSTHTTLHTLVLQGEARPSPTIINAIETQTDALIERYDVEGFYVQHLPRDRRSAVVVNTRSRLERMQVALQKQSDVFVLPNFETLLCPQLLSKQIKQAPNNETKLSLFCLYQASHNHDAQTLYPLRFPANNSNDEKDQELARLKKLLLASCCDNCIQHTMECTAIGIALSAVKNCRVLLATHESFIQQELQRQRDLIIVDDADELQMHLVEYLAKHVTSKQIETCSLNTKEREAFKHLRTLLDIYVGDDMSNVGFRERILLQNFVPYLKKNKYGYEESILSTLEKAGPKGRETAQLLADFAQQASQKAPNTMDIHVYWLDLQFAHDDKVNTNVIEEWGIYGISINLQQAFRELFWRPYKQHIICGTAISLGNNDTTFFRDYFGLPEDIAFCSDKRPPFKIYIPTREEVRPASFLAQYSWATSVGNFLYRITQSKHNSILVTLQAATIVDALLNAFDKSKATQVLSPKLGWTTAKIAERIEKLDRQTLTFVSPRLRQTQLQEHVDVEITGPMRFMNQRDPLVAAQMLIYTERNKDRVFTSYLLPQALLELKARVSSSAELHIILDSSLREGFYKEQVRLLFDTNEILKTLPGMPVENLSTPTSFSSSLSSTLEQAGLGLNTNIAEKDLLLTLKTLWKVNDFRVDTFNQKNVVQNTLAGKDQLVIAPTGGGKSLCFQLPAILIAQDTLPKVTIIFSPLVALMKDQVQALHNKGIFCAMYFDNTHSGQDYLQGIKQGDYSIIYVAPEKIHNPAFCKAIQSREIGLIAIDEAHCVSQWGHNFRTDYFAIKHWLDKYTNRSSFPLLALTATARKGYVDSKNPNSTKENSTIGDVIEKLELNLKEEEVIIPSLKREELKFEVEHIPLLECTHPNFKERDDYCKDCREDAAEAKFEKLIALLTNKSGLQRCWDRPNGERQRGLIYCAYTKTVEDIKEKLQATSQLEGVYGKLRIGKFHGKMDSEDKDNAYKRFVNDGENGLDIIIATNAFGMGIDVRRLSFVIHFDVPGTPEAYYQEAGRAGRDAEFRKDYARCILLYNETDLEKQQYLINQSVFDETDVEKIHNTLQKLCTTLKDKEVLVSESELAIRSNVNENDVGAILHYLEHNTTSSLMPVIKRKESANLILQLQFRQRYKDEVSSFALSNQEKKLVHIFETQGEWRLYEQSAVDIDLNRLLAFTNGDSSFIKTASQLQGEITSLIRKGILIHNSKAHVSWKCIKKSICQMLNQLEEFFCDVIIIINKSKGGFASGKKVYTDLFYLHKDCGIDNLNEAQIGLFLFALSRKNADDLRLFDFFERDTKFSNSARYKLQRWKGQTASSQDVIKAIFKQLQDYVEEYAPDTLQAKGYPIDLFSIQNFKERQHLHQTLSLLEIFGFLTYTKELDTDPMLKIELLQKNIQGDRLRIDIKELKDARRNAAHKLRIMKEYATLPAEQRAEFFEKYFRGEIPLA